MKKLLIGVVLMLASSLAASATIVITPEMVGTSSTLKVSSNFDNRATWNIVGSSELASTNLLFDLIVTGGPEGRLNNLNVTITNDISSIILSTAFGTLIESVSLIASSTVTSVVAGVINGNGNLNSASLTITLSNIRNANVSEVPLPAAVWLFGSVLLGGLAVRRKAAQKRQLALAV